MAPFKPPHLKKKKNNNKKRDVSINHTQKSHSERDKSETYNVKIKMRNPCVQIAKYYTGLTNAVTILVTEYVPANSHVSCRMCFLSP